MPESKLLGSLREEGGKGVVRVEDVYDTDVADLWSAITDPARLARWLATVDGDLSVGGKFSATFTSSWSGVGRVDVCEPNHRLLVTTWDEEDDDGETQMEATLTAEGSRTRLVIEERGLPLDVYHHHGSGWQVHIEDLGAYLNGRQTSDWGVRARELSPAYAALVVGGARTA